jgi:DNA-binding CsgD family transcriptional regulator
MNPLALAPDTLPEMIGRLTPRQLEIVGLLAQGYNLSDASHILSISRGAVKRLVARSCKKLGADNRVQLIVIYAMWSAVNTQTNTE